MLFAYELRKVAVTRWLALLLVLLFIANLAVCATLKEHEMRDRSTDGEAGRLLALHRTDPDTYEKTLQEMRSSYEEKIAEYFAYMLQAEAEGQPVKNFDDEAFRSHVFSDTVDDGKLLSAVKSADENREAYEEGIENILRKAKQNAEELREQYGLDMTDYAYLYQAYVYKTYAALYGQADVGSDPVYGWDKLFSYSYGDLFLFVSLLFLSCAIALCDRPCGMTHILRCTKYGRGRTFAAKYALAAVSSVLAVLLYTAGAFGVLLIKTGFSSPFVSVQNIASLRFFPHALSIFGYLWLFLLLKILSALAFTSICLLLSELLRSALHSILAGTAFFGLQFFLSTLEGANALFVSRVNLISVSAALPVTERLYVAGIFGQPVSYLVISVVLLPVVALSAAALSIFLHTRRREGAGRLSTVAAKRREKIGQALRLRAPKQKTGPKYRGVGFWELHKLLFGSKFILVLILSLALFYTAAATVRTATYRQSRISLMYTELYLPELYGSYNEKSGRVEKVIAFYRDTDESLREVRKRLENGEIGEKEAAILTERLRDVRGDTGQAEEELRSQTKLFENLRADAGIDARYIDYRGWRALFDDGFCIPLYLSILLLAIRSFLVEYLGRNRQNRFICLLRSTKNGRDPTFRGKLLSLCAVTLVLALFYAAVRLIAHGAVYGFDDLLAPVQSTLVFTQFTVQMPILGYLVFFELSRLLAALLTALFFAAVCALLENIFAALAVCLSLTVIPSALAAAGLTGAKYLSFTDWSSVSGMMQTSSAADLFSSDLGLFALFTTFFAVLTAALLLIAQKKFVR